MSGRSHSQRRWTHGDLVVLRTLATSGETLGSLASRLGARAASSCSNAED